MQLSEHSFITPSVEFIKMMLWWFIKLISLRSIKLSSSQIRENCFFSSIRHPRLLRNLCIWLSALHIYCECKWVSWKIMCNKILFPAKFMPAKRNAFGLVPLHWKVHEMMLHNDNASCASLSRCCRFIAEIYIFTAMILLDWLQLNPNYFHAHIAFNYFHSPCATSSSSLWMRNAGEKVNG